jgi:polyvinyl alcohol dehydrogenase (cytochrome)
MKRFLVFALLARLSLSGPAIAQDPQPLYERNCASCHNGGMDRAPLRDEFRAMSAQRVLNAMETGAMTTMALRLNAVERRALAEFLTGKQIIPGATAADPPHPAALCSATIRNQPFRLTGPQWNGWGVNTSNTRYMDARQSGLRAADVPRLKVKWAFGFPGDLQAYSALAAAGGRLFLGSQGGRFYSLDAATGCIHWYADLGAGQRSAATVAQIGPRTAVFFGDAAGFVHALDVATGQRIWRVKIDTFPTARVTGSLTFHNGRLYVPVASGEEASAGATPEYECCKFRGALAALDAATGNLIWKYYTVPQPQPTTKSAKGTQLWGPSGAPIWSAPTIDPVRNAVYVTTGNNYSEPTTPTSDSFLALDRDTGRVLWSRQFSERDAYTSSCRLPDRSNCPDADGPDFDFASAPILVSLPGGKRALVAGQKSGLVHAIDPDNQGASLWETRVGKGGTMGGVQWGSAADANNMYVAVSDIGRIKLAYSQSTDADPNTGGGMFALSLRNGEKLWYTAPASCNGRPRCSPAQSAAVTAIPGIAFSASVDGHLRGYDARSGKVVWDFDTEREFTTVNKVPARGGSMDGAGPIAVGGFVYVNSGYPSAGGMSGNVLLAFSVDGK